LFTPDDGHFEYSAVATNLTLDLPALYAFICGRGAQEKTIAELKGEFALDVVPTRHYGANSAWQQLSILAHNLVRSFQLDTLATPKPRSRKRTYTYLIRSMRTELSSEVVDERERRRTLLGEVEQSTPKPRWQPGERYATHVEGYHHEGGGTGR
ncbi:MAG TPA: hypothetical protein VGV06_16835, partial [Methylomirabilota bacterium]|nr:hypothetical protein [Methylomirabilota bacterium]